MWRRAFLGCIAAACLTFGQQGHPLSGTWSGDWASSAGQRTQITVVMNWDGKQVSGQLNPGPDSVPLASVTLDVTNWTVKIDAKGVSAEGKIENLGADHRSIVGTWQQGNAKGEFKLTRD